MPEDLNDVTALREAIAWMREGEEGGYQEGTVPTPGQLYQQLHEAEPVERMARIEGLLNAAEAGRQCAMSLHGQNLEELRQRVMDSWNIFAALGRVCSDPARDGLVHVSEINELLPEALRRG